jgi:hypothetical protein
MNDIEDRLRIMLRDRVAAPPANPARRVQVRRRIAATRRRTAGNAIALVVAAVAGLLIVTRLPIRTEPLPPGVPQPPPYFTTFGQANVVGYYWTAEATSDLPAGPVVATRDQFRPFLLVAWCSRAGVLRVSTSVDGVGDVRCGTRVGGHYEGALPVSSADGERLFVPAGRSAEPPRVDPDGVGDRWAVVVLRRGLPDRLPRLAPGMRPPAQGPLTPDGTSFQVSALRTRTGDGRPLHIDVQCVEGVTLTFSGPSRVLATAHCEPDQYINGVYSIEVPAKLVRSQLDVPRHPFIVTVRRSGRDTDQWRVLSVS